MLARNLILGCLLCFTAHVSAQIQLLDISDGPLAGAVAAPTALEVLLGLNVDVGTEALLGDAVDFSEVVLPEEFTVDPNLPVQASGDQCRSVQKANSGFAIRYVNGGRFSAIACPNTANCVKIVECPAVASKCFEIQSCESNLGNCRKFAPCPCNITANSVKLVPAPVGVKFVAGSRFLRQECPSSGCFNVVTCPLSANGAPAAGCYDLQSCEGVGCFKIVACNAVTTTTQAPTTTTTPPSPCVREEFTPTGYDLVQVASVPSYKKVPCGPKGCFVVQACTTADIGKVRCFVSRNCVSAVDTQPKCRRQVPCDAATTTTTTTTAPTTTPDVCFQETLSQTGYRLVNATRLPAFKRVACNDGSNCLTYQPCTIADVFARVQCYTINTDCTSALGTRTCFTRSPCTTTTTSKPLTIRIPINFTLFTDLSGLPIRRLPDLPDVVDPIPSLSRFDARDGVSIPPIVLTAQPTVVNPLQRNLADLIEIGTGPLFTDNDLFEGDLKLSQDKIDLSYRRRPVVGRSTTTDPDALWPGRKVYYTFMSGLPASLIQKIRDAMDHWEDNTCLRFFARSSQSDYIEFRNDDDGCYSDSIGRDGGKQIINFGSGCEYFGIAVHEIGHAIGKWHEQTRPDRDQFVSINFDNIKSGKAGNFELRNNDLSDPLSVGYDFGSIMHYGKTAFSKNGKNTIEIKNNAAYVAQGSPSLGQRTALSSSDILQVNRLYTCPGSGATGILKVYIRYARNLEDRDSIGVSDPYVQVTAALTNGAKTTKYTSTKDGTTNPNFFENLVFPGGAYQHFRVKIWDSDGGLNGDDDALSISQTIEVTPGTHSGVLHCANLACTAYMWFDWEFTVDVNECASSPCQNGGVCNNLVSRYTCTCTASFTGPNCQYRLRSLQVLARYGKNLPDEDGVWNLSDPYLEFVATTVTGATVRRTTNAKDGTLNPVWQQSLNFGTNAFTTLKVKIWDSDGFFNGADDAMSSTLTLNVSPGSHTFIKLCGSEGCGGYVYFDYTLA